MSLHTFKLIFNYIASFTTEYVSKCYQDNPGPDAQPATVARKDFLLLDQEVDHPEKIWMLFIPFLIPIYCVSVRLTKKKQTKNADNLTGTHTHTPTSTHNVRPDSAVPLWTCPVGVLTTFDWANFCWPCQGSVLPSIRCQLHLTACWKSPNHCDNVDDWSPTAIIP